MFERLKYLYNAGRLTEAHLDAAISKNWITAEQMQQIIGV